MRTAHRPSGEFPDVARPLVPPAQETRLPRAAQAYAARPATHPRLARTRARRLARLAGAD